MSVGEVGGAQNRRCCRCRCLSVPAVASRERVRGEPSILSERQPLALSAFRLSNRLSHMHQTLPSPFSLSAVHMQLGLHAYVC